MSLLKKSIATCCLMLTALVAVAQLCAADDEAKLEGKWKLVVLAFGEDEFLVLDVKDAQGAITGGLVAAQPFLGSPSIMQIESKGDGLTVMVVSAGQESPFTGTLAKEGGAPRPFLGTFRFRNTVYPARLERTDADNVAPLNRGPLPTQAALATREPDAKSRVAKLEKILADNPTQPFLNGAYAAIFQAAESAGLTPEQVAGHLRGMLATAQPYGEEWTSQVRLTALRALSGKRPFADVAFTLATAADQALASSATTEDQAAFVSLYASAARLAGKADLAATLEAKSTELEAKLDAEYHEKVPPFKPASYAGRKDAAHDRVVVFELFTGAQCPPCVAADVAFDALIKAYQPSELVALQYHVHIPGPDPLTNRASLARASYYGVRSAPSTFFNGELAAAGGGGMPQSQGKHDEYRTIIDPRLETKKPASIDLQLQRSGDTLQISATATADLSELADKSGNASDKPAAKAKIGAAALQKDDSAATKQSDEPKPKLYLVVTEESIRYVGGNKIRFHHHVVRAFAGEADGKPLAGGSCDVKLTLDLNDVRQELNGYLDDYQKTGSFPNPLPAIELKGLSIVAFVQDDTSKRILHAVSVPVPEVN